MSFTKPNTGVVLTTNRLTLRPFRKEDWSAVHRYAADPEISMFQGWGPNSEEDSRDFVVRCMDDTSDPAKPICFFSVTLLGEDSHIGGCRISLSNSDRETAVIGYTIDRSHWNRGYATEMVNALLGFAFDRLALQKVNAECDTENIGSWRVMEKNGMCRNSIEENAKYFKGRWRDWYHYSISASEWEVRQGNTIDASAK
jgi:[ribosomal protein S5]-alanine N-acetyltransferase